MSDPKDPPKKRPTHPHKGKGKEMRVGRGKTQVKPLSDGTDPTEGGQYCGARKKGGGFCRHPAGHGTDHEGEGRCRLHGGLTPVRSGRYSSITNRKRIAELIEKFEDDPDPLNLLPEVAAQRAALLEFIERYDEMFEGLMRWNLSFNRDFRADWAKWWKQERGRLLAGGSPDDADAPDLPDPMDYLPPRPVTIVDISTLASLASQVGATVERINRMKEDKTYSMGTISRLYEVMGGDLETVAREMIKDDATRDALLDAVETRWKLIQLGGLAGPRPRTGPAGPE